MLSRLIDLVLPRRCLGCGQPGTALCVRCGEPRPVQRYLRNLGTVHAACRYEGGVRRAVIAYKERGRRELAEALGALLAASVTGLGPGPPTGTTLVPVPSSAAARRHRDYDHMALLATTAAVAIASADDRSSPPAAVRPLLRVCRPLADSSSLGPRERRIGLAGAFSAQLRRPDEPASVVVVDDVITTGASVREAARALQGAGWRVDGICVVAATPRRGPARDRSGDHRADRAVSDRPVGQDPDGPVGQDPDGPAGEDPGRPARDGRKITPSHPVLWSRAPDAVNVRTT